MVDWQGIPAIPVIPLQFREFRLCYENAGHISQKPVSFILIMIQLFGDYREIVVADYFRKKEANTISPRLARPTPALLKEASIAKCIKGIDKKDYENLMVFFEKARDVNALTNAIEKCDIDKFRPLVNLLKKKTKETEDKNVELLAWLIDYPDRPYEYGKSYRDSRAGSTGSEKEKGKEEERFEDAPDGDDETKNDKYKGIKKKSRSHLKVIPKQNKLQSMPSPCPNKQGLLKS